MSSKKYKNQQVKSYEKAQEDNLQTQPKLHKLYKAWKKSQRDLSNSRKFNNESCFCPVEVSNVGAFRTSYKALNKR